MSVKPIAIFLNGIPHEGFPRTSRLAFEDSSLEPDGNVRLAVAQYSLTGRDFSHAFIADGGDRHFQSLFPAASMVSFPVTWVGDGDSRAHIPLSAHVREVMLPKKKDVSDFGALLEILGTLPREDFEAPLCIEVLAGLGGRRDHELMNLFECAWALETELVPRNGVFLFHTGVVVTRRPVVIDCPTDSEFSLLSASGNPCSVTLSGAEYDGTVTLTRPSHGLSNRVVAPGGVRISPCDGRAVILFF